MKRCRLLHGSSWITQGSHQFCLMSGVLPPENTLGAGLDPVGPWQIPNSRRRGITRAWQGVLTQAKCPLFLFPNRAGFAGTLSRPLMPPESLSLVSQAGCWASEINSQGTTELLTHQHAAFMCCLWATHVVLLSYSHLSHLLLSQPPSLFRETKVRDRWDEWDWSSGCIPVRSVSFPPSHSTRHHEAAPPPVLSIGPQPWPTGVLVTAALTAMPSPGVGREVGTLSRACTTGHCLLPVQAATAEASQRLLGICCIYWTPDEV